MTERREYVGGYELEGHDNHVMLVRQSLAIIVGAVGAADGEP
jgi:hypothetical protein